MDEKELKKERELEVSAQSGGQTGDTGAQTTAAPAEGVTTGKKYEAPTLPETGYTSPYDGKLEELYKSITERKPFSYDASDDAMYQQYRDRYMQLGQEAMRDTQGQAAALTGGYGSTYAQRAGQQAYDSYLLGLNDRAAELYEAAYQRYKDEGDEARRNYSLLGDLADRDYDKWADAYQRAMQRYELGVDEAGQRAAFGDMSGIAGLYGDEAAAGAKWQYAYANPDAAYQSGVITAEEYFNITGMYPKGYVPEGGVATGSGGGWSGVDYDNKGIPTAVVKEAQKALGVKADGLIGNKTINAMSDYTGDSKAVQDFIDYYNRV